MRKERSSKLWLTIPPDVDVPVRISESVAKLGNPREETIFDRVDSGLGNMKKSFVSEQSRRNRKRKFGQEKRRVDGLAVNISNEQDVLLLSSRC